MLFILKGRLLVLREIENNTKFYDNLWERKFGNVNIVNLHARTNFAPNRNLTPQKIPHIEEQLISDGSYWGTMGLQDTKPLSYIYFIYIINNSGHATNTEHTFDCIRDYDII